MHIMIHACPAREWYVNEYLVPSIVDQGISRDEITIWMDRDGVGNLASCLESFAQCSKHDGETWHLQDDVIVCRDFADRIRAAPDGLALGFCVDKYEWGHILEGPTTAHYMWQSSFPCLKIPNILAGEFVDWLVSAQNRPEIYKLVQTGKKDDTLFWIFMQENHKDMRVTNISPHLVDHVDWLIGGSTINQWREDIVRSCRWNDENLITELSDKLAGR